LYLPSEKKNKKINMHDAVAQQNISCCFLLATLSSNV